MLLMPYTKPLLTGPHMMRRRVSQETEAGALDPARDSYRIFQVSTVSKLVQVT